MHLPHRVTAVAVAALLLIFGLAGCSNGGDDSGSSSSGEGGSSGRDVSGGRPGVDAPGKPVVKATFDSSIAQGAKVDIAIQGLRVKGRLATLGVQLTSHIPGTVQGIISPYKLNGERVLDTSLIDSVNLKRYVVVTDSASHQLQSDDITTLLSNEQPADLTYTFAAPPENVKAIDVQIGSWPTFRDVPVQR